MNVASRLLRFRLRTLFLIVLLVSVFVCIYQLVWMPHVLYQNELKQEAAMRRFRTNFLREWRVLGRFAEGHKSSLSYFVDSPLVDHAKLESEYMYPIKSIEIYDRRLTADFYDGVSFENRIERIEISNCQPVDLVALSKLKSLRILVFEHCSIANKDIEFLESLPNLCEIRIEDTEIDIVGLERICEIPNVERVYLASGEYDLSRLDPFLRKKISFVDICYDVPFYRISF